MKKKVFLVNNMFGGSYLNMGDNIGHEFINLYKSDNNKSYAYVQPRGSINQNIDYIINVIKKSEPGVVQIVSYAKVKPKNIDSVEEYRARSRQREFNDTKNKNKCIHKKQKEFIDKELITYSGLKLYDFFKKNHKGQDEIEKNKYQFYVSFETEDIMIPNKNALLRLFRKIRRRL